MLATVWRQLAKNPLVVVTVSRQNAVDLFVLVSYDVLVVPGSATPDETGELGPSPQLFPARAGGFLRLRRDRQQRPLLEFLFGCFALDRPGRSGAYRVGWIQIASIPDPHPQPPLLRFLRRLRRAALTWATSRRLCLNVRFMAAARRLLPAIQRHGGRYC